ncbi:uncharacterized protein LOC122107737 [Dipodomys spectabilis]|uniref:uncharacterized protein LOC122107737 n=1 Tax=Dipodomys spectabilis TaxID=105255 RepID=UPI001C548220|nr:uncharacterized protein LOC122107737 [Dipodomys spectabilis]
MQKEDAHNAEGGTEEIPEIHAHGLGLSVKRQFRTSAEKKLDNLKLEACYSRSDDISTVLFSTPNGLFLDSIFTVAAADPVVLSQLFVRAQELRTLEVTGQEKIAQIKARVPSLEGIVLEDQVLLLAGMPLEDDATLGQCGVEALATLQIVGRLPRGKVHGSLAHDGKVRSQTPKVAKQKKKKTGLAKGWMQYNPCFVNVVLTFGNKKDRNANS